MTSHTLPAANRVRFQVLAVKPLLAQIEDLEERMRSSVVVQIAESIQAVGVIHEPVLSAKTHRILTGRDIVAALALLESKHPGEWPTSIFKVIRCTGAEGALMQEAERLQGAGAINPIPAFSCDRTRARKKRKVKRFSYGPPIPEIELFGLNPDDEFIRGTKMVRLRIGDAQEYIRRALGQLKTLRNHHQDTFPADAARSLIDLLEDNHQELKGWMPASLCPWCKGVAVVQHQCIECMRFGWVGPGKASSAPAELRNPPHKVRYHGELFPIARFTEEDEDL